MKYYSTWFLLMFIAILLFTESFYNEGRVCSYMRVASGCLTIFLIIMATKEDEWMHKFENTEYKN